MNQKREDIRNVAIIAHVDHGKTTLVDELLKQSGVFRDNQEMGVRVMDSNPIERERGITILSKNTAVHYKSTKINIVDTPGHADFGGEVERILKMVNGAILLVDAFEGPMPQTRFVLQKALDLRLPVMVVINKIDKPQARPAEVEDEVLELMMDLNASDEQLDCPFLYASSKEGFAKRSLDDDSTTMEPLFQTILDYIPAPEGDPDADTQMLVSTIDYNEFVGRIGVGKIDNGSLKLNQEAYVVNHHDPDKRTRVRITKLYTFDGLARVDVNEASCGEIVAVSGIEDLHVGDTIVTGEAATMSEEEHMDVIRFIIKAVNHRIPVIAGTGSNCTATAIDLSKQSEEAGADGVLLVTPYYNKATQGGLIQHYEAVAGAISLPCILYNVPSRTGVTIQPETMAYLYQHVENIVGVKDATGNISMITKLMSLVDEDFLLFSGDDDQIVPLLSVGASGVISVLSNVAPRETHEICQKWFDGDIKGAREAQFKAYPLIKALFAEVNPIPVKAALNLMGKNVGSLRLPMTEATDSTKALLKDEMTKYGIL